MCEIRELNKYVVCFTVLRANRMFLFAIRSEPQIRYEL